MSLFDVYPLMEIEPVRGEGCYLWDKNGKRYLDMYGGHAVISVGHNHPDYVKRITEQLNKLSFYSNSVINSLQKELSERLLAICGYDNFNLFLCNSGAEANENALKIASFFNGRKKVIAFNRSFHGRTSAALSVTDDKKISAPINDDSNVIFIPLNNIEALNVAMYDNKIAAVIVEGIQGVGGIHAPTEDFLKRIRVLCDYTGALFIIDEIQSGYGRTGKFFAHQYHNVKPDIITIAKGMGNGFPVAGVLIHKAIEAKHGMLGTTFGGNHLACAASLAVLEIMAKEGLQENAKRVGEHLIKNLSEVKGVIEVRGKGLMLGIQLEKPAAPIRQELFEKYGILVGSSSDKNTLRILPPLNLSEMQSNEFIEAFRFVMEDAPIKPETIAITQEPERKLN
jgi:acetylornithine/N-succinyldiaminopimelate aminotransferase